MKAKRRWRTLLVDQKFQLKFVGLIFGTGFILVSFHYWYFYNAVTEQYRTLTELVSLPDAAMVQWKVQNQKVLISLALGSLYFLIMLSVAGLIFSHRIAGPIYRFRMIIDQVSKGNMEARVQFRPNDEFQKLAKAFNQMMDSIARNKGA